MFHGAKWSYSQGIIALLLQDGWSPLMIASEKEHLNVLIAIIEQELKSNMVHQHCYS